MNILGTFRSSGVLPSASSRFVTDGAHDAFIHGAMLYYYRFSDQRC